MGFSRQEYQTGLPFLSPGIFVIQRSNPGLLHVESNKIQQTSDYNKKRSKLIDTENKLVVTSGEREEEKSNIGVRE